MNGKKRTREIRDGVLYISCTKCDGIFPETDFYKINRHGKTYINPWCLSCSRKYSKIISAQRHAEQKGISIKQVMENRAKIAEHNREQKQLLEEVNRLFGGVDNIPDLKTDNGCNICFDCQNACGGCSWTAVDTTKRGKPIKFEPVDGWDAELVYRKGNTGTIVKTYSIKSCPQFVPDEPRKPQHIVDGK